MSWVSLSGSDGGDSGKNSYKEVAKQAFASPTNLSSRLGIRNPSKEGMGVGASGSVSNRRAPSRISSKDEAEAFHQMFNSTAVQVSKKHAPPGVSQSKSSDLGEGLRALARRASRQYHADLNSTDAEASTEIEKESFSIGSVSRRTKDLDLAHNDNSFHVIGGLIVEFFQSKQKAGIRDLRLTPQDIAQLDRLAPPRVRASFVEAVRFRFTNAPMDSTSSVHMLARQCHDLGLDAEGPHNPLLVAAETEIVIPFPQTNNRSNNNNSTSSRYSSGASESTGESVTPSGSTPSSYPYPSEHAKADPGAPVSTSQLMAEASHPLDPSPSFLIGRPPRQSGEDPPAGASVSTRLTKLGVEIPYGSETGSGVSSTGSLSQSHTSSVHKPDPSEGSQAGIGSVRTSLTKFGIEMPRYGGSVSSQGGGVSVLTDMKSMTTSLTRLGVEIPLDGSGASNYASASSATSDSAHSGVSHSSGQKSRVSSVGEVPGPATKNTQHQNHQAESVAPILTMSSKADEESTILPASSSKDFSNSVGLAKQQLLAELREASNLMSESKTHEAAKFWRDHVLELEARLRALNGEEASVVSHLGQTATTAVSQTEMSLSVASPSERPAAMPNAVQSIAVNTFVANPAATDQVTSPPSGTPSPAASLEQAVSSSQMSAAPDPVANFDNGANFDTGSARAPLMIDPSLEGVPMVDVVAPADLPGGYHFEAEIEGRRFLATVPAGGVQKGETFSCYMRDLEKVGSDIPVGRWRDGLFDCCSIGCCHPVICNALFCPLVILGQIMTRVGFDFLGRPSLDNSVNGPNTLWTILCFWVFVNAALFSAYNFKWSQGMELSVADLGALAVVNVAYLLFVVYLTSATRGSLREKYYIRESRFHDLEDCCCATFCLPCAVCQMARHTADYDEYEGVCCNDTGLPDSYAASTSEPKQNSNYLV